MPETKGAGAQASPLTHLNQRGEAHMIDVGAKAESRREAVAMALVRMQPQTLELVLSGQHKKGDVLAVARIAGIQAAKKCWELIPLCHPLMLDAVEVEIEPDRSQAVLRLTARCRVHGRTGVEMEAMTAVSVAALTLYDMCKAVDRGISIEQVRLLHKSGGKSGLWQAEPSATAQPAEQPMREEG